MNDLLSGVIDNNSPKFNKNVVDGSINKIFKTFPQYLDYIFKSSILSLTKGIGLSYLGYRKMSPKEEIDKLIMTSENNVMYDVSNNDVYPIELMFTYNDVKFSRYLYLPYADRGNIINFSGTPYHVVPVLSDNILSPNHKEIFVRLLKAKLSFKSVVKNFIVNGDRVPGEVINCQILRVNEAQIVDNIGKPLVAVSSYLTAEKGFKGALKHYCGIHAKDIIITHGDTSELKGYDIYESTKIKPRGLKENIYTPHDVKICIKQGNYNITLAKNIIFGTLYIFDMFSESANEMVDVINNGDFKVEKMYWQMYIGRLSYKNTFSIDRMYGDVVEHFDSLEGYIDNDTKDKLKNLGRGVNTFFDLVALVMENYSTWVMNSKEYNSSIENRYIDVKYYILYDIIIGFNRIILNINKRMSKKSKLSLKEIQSLFKSELSPKLILSLTKSSSMNLAIQGCSYTADIMYPKITSLLEDRFGLYIKAILY